MLWRTRGGKTDLMSTVSAAERDAFRLDGQVFCLPATHLKGNRPVYRLSEPRVADHIDYAVPGEAGYRMDGLLGYVFTSSGATGAISALIRTFNGSNGGHGLIHHGERPLPATTRKRWACTPGRAISMGRPLSSP